MNDLLLFGLIGAAVEGYIAVLVVLWMVYRRPRFMMRWAVREAASMSSVERILWRAVRRGRRAFVDLQVVVTLAFVPQLVKAEENIRVMLSALEAVQTIERPTHPRAVLSHRIAPDPTLLSGSPPCPVCDGERALPPLGRCAAYRKDWKPCPRCRGEDGAFVRCNDDACLDRRLHYVQDCPPADMDAYQFRKLEEEQG